MSQHVMKFISLVLMAFIVAARVVVTQETINVKESIDRIKKCYPSTADINQFNKCLFDFWQEVRPLLPQGIPELNIPRLDPLFIDRLLVDEEGKLVKGRATFTNVTVRGFSSYVPKKVMGDIPSQTITIEISIPEVHIAGYYDIDGEALLFKVQGNGDFWLKVKGIDAQAVAHIEREGTGLRLGKLDLNFSATHFSGRLNNLLGGEEVGEAVIRLLNDNAQEIFEDVKPLVTSRMSEVISQVLTGSIKYLPAEAFILPEGFVAPEGVEIPADFIVPTPRVK